MSQATLDPVTVKKVPSSSPQGAPTFGRYTEIPTNQLTKEQQEGYRAFQLVEGDGSPTLPGPLKIWLNNPALTLAVAPLATHFRPTHHTLTTREREIIVCVVAGKSHSPFATNAHAEILEGLGVSTEQTEALTTNRPTSFTDPGEQLVYDIAVTVLNSQWVPRTLYDRAVKTFGHDKICDVLVLMGMYTAISLTVAFYDVAAGEKGLQR
jgi:4-carboxymuconolactone decarboxylase